MAKHRISDLYNKHISEFAAPATQESAPSPIAELAMTLLHAVTKAHLLHFQTTSYAAHKALGELYDGIEDLADTLVEAYQGKYGLISDYPPAFALPSSDPVTEVVAIRSAVSSLRQAIPQDSELQNIVDEIVSLMDSSIYKLRFLS